MEDLQAEIQQHRRGGGGDDSDVTHEDTSLQQSDLLTTAASGDDGAESHEDIILRLDAGVKEKLRNMEEEIEKMETKDDDYYSEEFVLMLICSCF